MYRRCIAAVCQHEVDQPVVLIDDAKQILPLADRLDMGLVHPWSGSAITLIPANSFLQSGRIAMNPTLDRDWIDAALVNHVR